MDDEMEAQYKMVYNRAMARNDASAEINLVSSPALPLSYSMLAAVLFHSLLLSLLPVVSLHEAGWCKQRAML